MRQISRDHSEVQELVDAGLVSLEAARIHPRANVVTRAVGAEDGLTLEMVQDQLRVGDLFLLCSDGLTKLAEDAEIQPLLSIRPLEAAARALVDLALARGGTDNVTVVLAEASAGERLDAPMKAFPRRIPCSMRAAGKVKDRVRS